MAGIIPDEGKTLLTNLIFKGGDVDRGATLELGLMVNTSVSAATTFVGIIEPTGGTYQRIPLVDANWTLVGGYAVYAKQTFTPLGSDYGQPVYGYFIATTGTTPRLLCVEADANGPYNLTVGALYDITPKVKL